MADCNSLETRTLYRDRRASSPVFFDERAQSFFIYRHDDVKAVMADWQSFSSDFGGHAPGSALDKIFQRTMNATDPPRHLKLRSLIARAFTARSVEDLAPRVSQAAHALIDRLSGRGQCDLIEDFAGALPVLALAELLGVPGEKHAFFRAAALQYTESFESLVSDKPVDMRPQEALDAYFRGLIEERRERPREDLISRLLEAEVDGERLSEPELLAFCKLLLIAGISTTARLLGSAVLSLLEHPEELARLRADLRLLPSAVEEVLRYRPPVNVWFRIAAKDVELRGKAIRAKQPVIVVIGSANRDEACFAAPDRFDITRDPNPHLAFSGGIHFCMGAPLARLEAKLALAALLERLEDLELANDGPLETLKAVQANGVVRLPLRFRPAARR